MVMLKNQEIQKVNLNEAKHDNKKKKKKKIRSSWRKAGQA